MPLPASLQLAASQTAGCSSRLLNGFFSFSFPLLRIGGPLLSEEDSISGEQYLTVEMAMTVNSLAVSLGGPVEQFPGKRTDGTYHTSRLILTM